MKFTVQISRLPLSHRFEFMMSLLIRAIVLSIVLGTFPTLSTAMVCAQQSGIVYGKIEDYTKKTPIEGAKVYVFADNSFILSEPVLTNRDGIFESPWQPYCETGALKQVTVFIMKDGFYITREIFQTSLENAMFKTIRPMIVNGNTAALPTIKLFQMKP